MSDMASSRALVIAPLDERSAFLRREAAEVYLLLDFLSGRTDRSLRPTQEEMARSLLDRRNNPTHSDPTLEVEREKIENDLADPTRLLQRTFAIRYPPEEGTKNFESDAAFLLRARDALNSRAAPTSGATIAFSALVFQHAAVGGPSVTHVSGFANEAYPAFSKSAKQLNRFIGRTKFVLVGVLLLALAISGYTAWGKFMLDSMDTLVPDLKTAASPKGGEDGKASVDVEQTPISIRHAAISGLLKVWARPMSWACSGGPKADPKAVDTTADPKAADTTAVSKAADRPAVSKASDTTDLCAHAGMAVLGNYVMPILYALLGSMASVLRRHGDRLSAQLLTPRDRPANHIRLLLGLVIGGCIGLFYSGSPVSQTTGLLGVATTLSAAALAFLAGYGVEATFKTLDALIAHIFRINSTDKPATLV